MDSVHPDSVFAPLLAAFDQEELCSFNRQVMDFMELFQASTDLQFQLDICQRLKEIFAACWWTGLLPEYRKVISDVEVS